MKNAKEAIRYGIETLGVSPDEMFGLIESSKGYDGEDYSRWLANEIIKIAEKDGVGYSQLLVKKFNIIQDMLGSKDLILKSSAIDVIKSFLGEESYSIDFPEVGSPLEDVDWFNGVDYDDDNSFFLAEELPFIYDKVVNGDDVNIAISLTDDSVKKSWELYSDASGRGVSCKYTGSLLLYRMCQMLEAFDIIKGFNLVLFTDTEFLLDSENESIWKYFLQYFNVKGVYMTSTELYEGALGGKDYAILVCKPRVREEIQDSILLSEGKIVDGSLSVVPDSSRRYTRSSRYILNALLKKSKTSSVVSVPKEYKDGLSGESVINSNNENTLGYLNVSISLGAWLSTFPAGEKGDSIEITEDNLEEVMIYYSVSTALKTFGISEMVRLPLSGDKKRYSNLLSNCLPLFLYGNNSRFRAYELDGKQVGKLSPKSDYVLDLLEKYEMLFSFESKELVDLCKKYEDSLVLDDRTVCFDDIRKASEYSDFNSEYISKVRNLSDYIRGIYKEVS